MRRCQAWRVLIAACIALLSPGFAEAAPVLQAIVWPEVFKDPPDLKPMTPEDNIRLGGASALIDSKAYQTVADGWEKALRLHEKSYGPAHPRTAFIRVKLAECWIDLRRFADAEREILMAEQAINIRTEPGHPLRVFAMGVHSQLLGRQLRIAEQMALVEHMLVEFDATTQKEPGRPLPRDALRGLLAARKGDYREAERFYRSQYEQSRSAVAAPLADRASAADNLATQLIAMGREREADALLAPLVQEAEQDVNANKTILAQLLETVGEIAESQGQYARTERALLRARELRNDDLLLNPSRASATRTAVRLTRSRRLSDRFDTPFGAYKGPGDFSMGLRLDALPKLADGIDALVVEAAADIEEAGPLWSGETLPNRRALLAFYEKAFGADHPQTARIRRALAKALLDSGKAYTAESEIVRALAGQRAAMDSPNDETGRSLLLLGRTYLAQGRRGEALAALDAALGQFDGQGGPGNYWSRETLIAIAATSEAMHDNVRSANAWARIGALAPPAPDDMSIAVLGQMTGLMQHLVAYLGARKQCLSLAQREQFAEQLHQLGQTMNGASISSSIVDAGYYTLAEAEACAGRFDDAARALAKARGGSFSLLGDAAPRAAAASAIRSARLVRAFIADDRRMRSNAIDTGEQASGEASRQAFQSSADIGWELDRAETTIRNLVMGSILNGNDLDAVKARSQIEQGGRSAFDSVFSTRLDFEWRAHELQYGPGPAIDAGSSALPAGRAIVAAQDIERASAAQQLAQANARLTNANTAMGALARRREQLSAEQRSVANAIARASVSGSSETEATALAQLRNRSEMLLSELAKIDGQLKRDFPAYFSLTRPQGLSVAEIQSKLSDSDALLMVRPNGVDVHVFLVTKNNMAWNKLTGAESEIASIVSDLRCDIDAATCGLDAGGGSRGSAKGPPRLRSGEVLDAAMLGSWEAPKFDRQKAWRLYSLIFEPVAKLFAKELDGEKEISRLYTVISGPLATLPLGTLVTIQPEGDTSASKGATLLNTSWLADRFTLVGLPSVSSLALKPSPADSAGLSVVGYGDPVLGMKQTDAQRINSFLQFVDWRDDHMRARPNMLRALDRLPGTRAELEAIGGLFENNKVAIHLQAAATEAAVKNDSGLYHARNIIFSTHGLLPGEAIDNIEPGLVMTPPDLASDQDDGLLTASEAATLSLDADLLILSACNTATTDGTPGAESLSSLSRAFLYAGTRGIYASHWRVSDDVTSRLMLIALGLRRDGKSRAEALSLAMRAIRTGHLPDGKTISGWTPDWAHPAAWAPFVIISGVDE